MRDKNRLFLALILAAYLGLGGLYAACTPPWQVPDEPAHYNYIRAIAEDGVLPQMEPGDYDQAYLERITAERFPPDLSIEPLHYEDHQPPLYYLLAAPVYRLFDGALLPLRLFSVGIGLGVLLFAWKTVRSLCPDRSQLALTAVALIAFLPQHLAMMAGVNNDPLAEVMVAASLWMAVRCLRGEVRDWQSFSGWGLLLGLTVLTKTTAYVALPVSLLAVGLWAWGGRREGGFRRFAGALGSMALPAALLASPWLARNGALYGWADPLGLARHNAVVVGQPRTAEWMARYGWGGLAARFLRTTFQSFWGQFGWMGVPLQPAVYLSLALFTLLLASGFAAWLFDRRRPSLSARQRAGAWVLTASALLTASLYLYYNRTFVQHQGRYLFPALVPLALAGALGLEWLLAPRAARGTALGLASVAALLVAWRALNGSPPLLPIGTSLALALLFGLTAWWRQGHHLARGALALGLILLDLYALFGAIVPSLTE